MKNLQKEEFNVYDKYARNVLSHESRLKLEVLLAQPDGHMA